MTPENFSITLKQMKMLENPTEILSRPDTPSFGKSVIEFDAFAFNTDRISPRFGETLGTIPSPRTID